MAAPVLRQARINADQGDAPPSALPEVVASEPERDAAMSLVIECWQTCSSDRPVVPFGMGGSFRGEIPYASIRAFAADAGIEGDDLLTLAQVIRKLDAERTEDLHNRLTAAT